MNDNNIQPTEEELKDVFLIKYESHQLIGWGPQMRSYFNYYTPDDYYEAVVQKLVTPGCNWLDVGCGRYIFPSNERLARMLADRCATLVGVDPDETIEENTLVHQRVKTFIEYFETNQKFDLVTLRMAAEHIIDPDRAVYALSQLTKSGGKVIIYTVNRWSPIPIVTWILPFILHHPIKRLLWRTEQKDTFPVSYRMNTRKKLAHLFEKAGFQEYYFTYLDDCRTFSRFRITLFLELSFWKILHIFGFRYPENCLLGVYMRI